MDSTDSTDTLASDAWQSRTVNVRKSTSGGSVTNTIGRGGAQRSKGAVNGVGGARRAKAVAKARRRVPSAKRLASLERLSRPRPNQSKPEPPGPPGLPLTFAAGGEHGKI